MNVSSVLNGVDISKYDDIQDVSLSKDNRESRIKEQFLADARKEEKKEKGKDGLWKEPDFGEWFERIQKGKKVEKKQEKKFNFLGL